MPSPPGQPARPPPAPRRRAVAVVYVAVMLVALCGLVSFGVDYGRVQLAKSQLQAAADGAARAAARAMAHGPAQARADAASLAGANICLGSPIQLVTAQDVQFGNWDASSETFTPVTGAAESSAQAIRVTTRRIAARDTAVPLIFARAVGRGTCDVSAWAVAFRTPGRPPNAIVGLQDLSIHGNILVDSYRSSSGPYSAGSALDNGTIASNGDITLTGSVTVRGDAHPGDSGSVSTTGGATITGSQDPVPTAMDYPAISAGSAATSNNNALLPAAYTTGGSFDLGSNKAVNMPAGTYYFQDFTIAGNAVLNVQGVVTIYVERNVSIGGSILPASGLPDDVSIQVIGPGTVALSNNGQIYADLYAPRNSITTQGTFQFYGAMVGRTVAIGGNPQIHFDETMTGRVGWPERITLVQ